MPLKAAREKSAAIELRPIRSYHIPRRGRSREIAKPLVFVGGVLATQLTLLQPTTASWALRLIWRWIASSAQFWGLSRRHPHEAGASQRERQAGSTGAACEPAGPVHRARYKCFGCQLSASRRNDLSKYIRSTSTAEPGFQLRGYGAGAVRT